jgi:hypothetical protein
VSVTDTGYQWGHVHGECPFRHPLLGDRAEDVVQPSVERDPPAAAIVRLGVYGFDDLRKLSGVGNQPITPDCRLCLHSLVRSHGG